MRSLAIDSTISHYRIKELIGRGGMGEVYKAVDIQLGRVVALKTLLSEKAADEDARRRFLREARAASILSHPSICTIYEVGQEGDVAFISMQYLEGNTIHDILAKGPLRIEDALSYALDIADALDEAHRNGVIHRDIKPSNIIVNERGLAVVLDFGLAKQVGYLPAQSEDTPTLLQVTTTATIVGTVPYMSPEQLRGDPLDARSDIFSFGSTLYETLTGKLPFSGRSPIDVTHSILHGEPIPVHQARMDLDAELDAIVRKALQKEPDARYPSASELKADLAGYIQRKGLAVKSISSESSARVSTAQTQRFPTGRLGLTTGGIFSRYVSTRNLLLVLLGIILVGAIWFLLLRPRRGSDSDLIASLRHVQLADWKSEAGEGDSAGTFSPDGKTIAFASSRAGHMKIWIKLTGGGEPIQITKDDMLNLNPIWSPDGRELAFVSARANQFGIWHVAALGGAPASFKIFEPFEAPLQLKQWSKSGGTIYYESNRNLFALDVASGQTPQVTQFDPSSSSAGDFSISPNEDWIAYVDLKDGQSDIWVMPTGGGMPVRVSNDPAEDRNPVWHPDGNRILYSSNRDGTFQICVAYLDGRKPLQLTFGERDCFVRDVSADGTRILYGASKEESDIWGVIIATGEEFEVTSEVGCEFWPDVSPDGQRIAFQAIREPSQGSKLNKCTILTKEMGTGGRQIQLAVDGTRSRWSPDGGRVAFLRTLGNVENIWTVRASGGDEKQLTTRGVYSSGNGLIPYNRRLGRNYAWSPDGSRVVYCSGIDDSNVFVISVDGSRETRISNNTNPDLYFACPLWSPNANLIAYLSETKRVSSGGKATRSVCLTQLATMKSEVIFESDSMLRLLGWSQSGNELVVAKAKKPFGEVSLIQIPTGGGNKRLIASIASLSDVYLDSLDLLPDARTVAFTSRRDGKDNIWLIRTIGGEARKLTASSDPRVYFSSMAFSPDGKTIYFGKQSQSSLISMIENFR
jgi:eukaryotic-like serine/threonine-protein kinase